MSLKSFIRLTVIYFSVVFAFGVLETLFSELAACLIGKTIGIDETGRVVVYAMVIRGTILGYVFHVFFCRPRPKLQNPQKENNAETTFLGLSKKKLGLGVGLGLSLTAIIIVIIIANGTVSGGITRLINLVLVLIGFGFGFIAAKTIYVLLTKNVEAKILDTLTEKD